MLHVHMDTCENTHFWQENEIFKILHSVSFVVIVAKFGCQGKSRKHLSR